MAVPNLRFPGFDGEWTQKNLNSILKVNSGRDYKHLDSGDIPVYGTGGYMTSVNEYLSNEDAIGIGRKGSIDKPQKLSAPFWTVDTLFYCTTINSTNLNFLYALFNKINWKSYDESTGVPSLSKKTIDSISVSVPNVAEQEVIGDFFRTIDEKIQLQQEKIDLLKEQKKGFMQKIFSQELRFKDEDGQEFPEWEKEQLGSLCDINTGNKDTQNKVEDGKYPFFVRSQIIEKINTYSYDGEAILTAGDGVGVGKVYHYINGKFDFHQRVYMLSNFKNCVGKFIYYYFSSNFMKEAQKYNAKTSVDSVRREMITKMIFPYPPIEEQKKIADLLTQLDYKINLEEQALNNLGKQKQTFMQQMFI